jgi:hypothetical protein
MHRRRPAALLWLLSFAGCLQEGPAPTGQLLFHGDQIESPQFVTVGDKLMVRFEDRLAFSTTTQGGISDVWITSFDGASQRKVVANRSDYWSEQPIYWSQQSYDARDPDEDYFMVDEHLVDSAAGAVRVASLVRLGSTLEEEFRLEGIVRYNRVTVPIGAIYDNPPAGRTCPGFPALQDNCPQLFYERPAESGQKYPTLMLWDGRDHLPLGADAGSFQLQTVGRNAYFLLDDHHTLTRLDRPGYALDSLRDNVYSFSVSGDEHYAALTVNEDGKSKTVIRDLVTGAEKTPARPNPSGWGGFSGHTFYYSQNATSTAPAELHAFNLDTGEDTFDVLPSPLVNSSGVLDRPNSDEHLILDSLGHGVFTGKNDLVGRRTLAGPLFTPSFTPDGKYLIYISPAAATLYDTTVRGPLQFQDADQVDQPPTMVSPPGLLVNAQNGASYFFTDGDHGPVLVFWAHLGRESSDLYFADYQSGSLPTGLRLIAKSIFSVSISAHTLFGILNVSQQDGVGDLVYMDLDKGVQTLYAHAVSDATEHGGPDLSTSYTAYVVRGRTDADRSGLWLTPLAPPVQPDGGTN